MDTYSKPLWVALLSMPKIEILSALLLFLALLGPGPHVRVAHADDVARISGGIKTITGNAEFTAGPGAVCARTEVTGSSDPAAGKGKGCNNLTMIGGGGFNPPPEPIISISSTVENGDFANKVFPKIYPAGLKGGQALKFNESEAANKLNPFFPFPLTLSELAISPSNLRPLVIATATQTVTKANPLAMPPTTDNVTWSATAAALTRPAFALSIVNDPVVVGLVDLSESSSAVVALGNGSDLMNLSVSAPGEFAVGLVEFGQGVPGTTIGLTIVEFLVDNTIQSLADAIDILQFDPSSGFASASALEAYLTSAANNFFSFDPGKHTLTENSEVPLLTLNLPAGSAPIEVVYNAEAIVGTVPEPSSLLLASMGFLALSLLQVASSADARISIYRTLARSRCLDAFLDETGLCRSG